MRQFLWSALALTCAAPLTVITTQAKAADPFTVYATFETAGDYDFTGNDPVRNDEFINKLRDEASIAARQSCTKIFGPDAAVARTGEGHLQEAILHIWLPVNWLCTRQINFYDEVVPLLVETLIQAANPPDTGRIPGFFASEAGYTDLIPPLLAQAGDSAAVVLISAVTDSRATDEAREVLTSTLGLMLHTAGGLSEGVRKELRQSLYRLLNEHLDEMIGYWAVGALAEETSAAYWAVSYRNELSLLAYADLVREISKKWQIPTSYAVQIGEFQYIFSGENSRATQYALWALRERGLTAAEFATILPQLRTLADVKSKLHDAEVFNILSLFPSESLVPLVVSAIDPSLIGGSTSEYFLYEAMLALQKFTSLKGVDSALPALKVIANSDANPQNRYLQILATQLIDQILRG